jgi:uracil-DNA glycosylase
VTKLSSQIFGNDWEEVLHEEFTKPYYAKLRQFLIKEYASETIYPQQDDLWTAFKLTPYKDVKVVILGQVICT